MCYARPYATEDGGSTSLRAGHVVDRSRTCRYQPTAATNAAGITDRSGPHLLGHAWVTTTQRYTHIEVEDLQAQVAELPANR